METVKLYVFEQENEIKGFVVANTIGEAMTRVQADVDKTIENEDYYRDLVVVRVPTSVGDYVVEVRENYKGTSREPGMTAAIIAERYDVFEFDFVMGRLYGTV